MRPRRVRVALATRTPVTESGGIEAAVRELAPRIASRRPAWDVRLLYAFPRITRWNRVPLFGDLVAAVLLAAKARRFDAVIVNAAEYAWPRALRRRDQARTLVVWHGTRAGEIPALVPAMSIPVKAYLVLETWLQRWALRAKRQIAVSVTTAREIESAYGSRAGVVVIPNGAPAIAPQYESCGSKGRGSPSGHRVAWLGTNAYKKGLDVALDACAIARATYGDLELVVVGVPAGETSPDWVDFAGRVGHAASLERLRSADVFLATSRYEGCSVAILEALALGVPIVAGPSVSWMVGAAGVAVAGFAPPRYAEALVALFARPERLAEMSLAAAGQVRAFDWNRAADAYVTEIEACLRAS